MKNPIVMAEMYALLKRVQLLFRRPANSVDFQALFDEIDDVTDRVEVEYNDPKEIHLIASAEAVLESLEYAKNLLRRMQSGDLKPEDLNGTVEALEGVIKKAKGEL